MNATMLWGRLETCDGLGTRQYRPIVNRPQAASLPHSAVHQRSVIRYGIV